MNNPVYTIIQPLLIENYYELINAVKILLYKENPSVFEILDFDNDAIFQDPFLCMYVKNKLQTLDSIIVGHTKTNKSIAITTDAFGKIYIPNMGWFHTPFKTTSFVLNGKKLDLTQNCHPIEFQFEPLYYIENTKIEILKYSIPSLIPFYCDAEGELLDVEICEITKQHLQNITKAYNLIRENIPSQFELIERYAPKCVIFNADPYKRNSFATFKANGISFYNAYQQDYDEVFFVDDIAHQTGHIILNTLTYDITRFLKVAGTTILEIIKLPDGTPVEKRNLQLIFHALYTYYTSFICLDACINANSFDKKQKHEAIGRIAFYLNKCYNDLLLIDNPVNSKSESEKLFTNIGLEIYNEIKNKWYEMFYKWFKTVEHFDMTNQPYNFTYSEFIKVNPIPESYSCSTPDRF